MIKLESLNAYELANLVKKRVISPTEVVDYFKDRIEKRNKSINAFVYTDYKLAYKKAKEIEYKLDNNIPVGEFCGVPYALKDFLDSKVGTTHSFGGVKGLITEDKYDSEFEKCMEKSDGIYIGKTNAPSYGFRGTTDNKLYGPSSTPFNTRYNSGDSSGGSASAVADGLVLIAEGGDAGGSIRIPAAWNNLFGYRPSVGTVPEIVRPDAFSCSHPYCFNFGLTKSVIDSAILLNNMARYDSRDPNSHMRNVSDFVREIKKPIKDIKIAYTDDFDMFEVSDEVKELTYQGALRFEKLGCKVERVYFNFPRTSNEYADIWSKAISIDTTIQIMLDQKRGVDILKDLKDQLPNEFIKYQEFDMKANILDLYDMNLARSELLDEFERVLKDYDFIISPITICENVLNSDDFNTLGPKEMNDKEVDQIIGFCLTFLSNFTGHPSASLPIGLTNNKLPIGLQIIGRKHDDASVLRACYHYEKEYPWKDLYDICFKRTII